MTRSDAPGGAGERRMKHADLAKLAADAHTNLNVFHAIVAILEGGTLYGPRPRRAKERIIAICQMAARCELAAMDRALESIDADHA